MHLWGKSRLYGRWWSPWWRGAFFKISRLREAPKTLLFFHTHHLTRYLCFRSIRPELSISIRTYHYDNTILLWCSSRLIKCILVWYLTNPSVSTPFTIQFFQTPYLCSLHQKALNSFWRWGFWSTFCFATDIGSSGGTSAAAPSSTAAPSFSFGATSTPAATGKEWKKKTEYEVIWSLICFNPAWLVPFSFIHPFFPPLPPLLLSFLPSLSPSFLPSLITCSNTIL